MEMNMIDTIVPTPTDTACAASSATVCCFKPKVVRVELVLSASASA